MPDTRVPKFKNPNHLINYGGQTIGAHNINRELYEELVKVAPAHADLFDLVEDTKKLPKEKSSE